MSGLIVTTQVGRRRLFVVACVHCSTWSYCLWKHREQCIWYFACALRKSQCWDRVRKNKLKMNLGALVENSVSFCSESLNILFTKIVNIWAITHNHENLWEVHNVFWVMMSIDCVCKLQTLCQMLYFEYPYGFSKFYVQSRE